jgi:pimeloyl-[acyl-carrier protein] methyl ester esterase
MNHSWINKANNSSCILFFNGWGMDGNVVSHLNPDDYDILMLNNYNPVTSINEDLVSYRNVFIVAWSLGVWAAVRSSWLSEIKIKRAIAINGTPLPVDDIYGINSKVFNDTLNTLTEMSYKNFSIRMFGGVKLYRQNLIRLSAINFSSQREELLGISNQISGQEHGMLEFDTAIFGNNDLIFTSHNQKNYWDHRARVVELNISHYPFGLFNSWAEIIDL